MWLIQSPGRKEAVSTLLLVFGYGLVLYAIQFFLSRAGMASVVPSAETLVQYDARIYKEIAEVGYTYPGGVVGSNAGWYVLFPWLWRLSHLGAVGISMLNLLLFAVSFALLNDLYPVSTRNKMLWLSTPSLYFMMVPYSEALFCLLTVVAFYGIARQQKWLIWTGLFLVSLTRATAVFLIPALLIMELLANSRKDMGRAIYTYLVHYAMPTLAGTAVFVLIQYLETGVWFAYFKVQADLMGHKFAMPVLPFSNFYGENRMTWFTGLAMLVCVIALVLLISKGYRWLFKSEQTNDRLQTLTLTYLPVILFTLVFFSPVWGAGTTNLLALHRYALCTPFIFVFLYHLTAVDREYKWPDYIGVFLLCNAVWVCMGAYVHIQQMLFYNFITLLVFGYMLHAGKKVQWATYAVIAINIFVQISFFQQYLKGLYTD